MLVQIYEVSSPEEANALAGLGVDHIGVLVGDGSFPRERTIDDARLIFSAIPSSSKGLALLLSSDVRLIKHVISELKPAIVHLGASTDLVTPSTVRHLKKQCGPVTVMRSIPVVRDESIAIAKSYDGIADLLLLDSHRPGDTQIGAAWHNAQLGTRQEDRRVRAYSRLDRRRIGARQRCRCHQSSAASRR